MELDHPQRPAKVPCIESLVSFRSLSSFSSDIVNIQAGPESQVLSAHKDILMKVDFFAACLAQDAFRESHTNSIHLPEDDYYTITQVIQFLYAGRLDLLDTVAFYKLPRDGGIASADGAETARDVLQRYCQLYMTADKYCIEELFNVVSDWLVDVSKKRYIHLGRIGSSLSAGNTLSPVAYVAVRKLATKIRKIGWQNYSTKEAWARIEADVSDYPHVGVALIKELALKDAELIDHPAFKDKCLMHMHVKSPKCSSSPTET